MSTPTTPKRVYVQIGAGAGDQDPRAGFRDGFTEYVKALEPSRIDKIVLVEPNPRNIPALRSCWKEYPQAEILQKAVRARSSPDTSQIFYYAEEDAPHFQVFSMLEKHVRKHYPVGTIQQIDILTLTIEEFLESLGDVSIELLAIDVEGIDAEIIKEVDWRRHACRRISFERLHLGKSAKSVFGALRKGKFFCIGRGLDVRGYDLLYAKPRTIREAIQLRYLWALWIAKRSYAYLIRRIGNARVMGESEVGDD